MNLLVYLLGGVFGVSSRRYVSSDHNDNDLYVEDNNQTKQTDYISFHSRICCVFRDRCDLMYVFFE